MSGVQTKSKSKRNPDTHGKEGINANDENKLAPEANMASFQGCLDVISQQIQELQNGMKMELRTHRDEITAQMKTELSDFKDDIYKKLSKITTDIGEQNEQIKAALERTEEIEMWSREANCVLQEVIGQQQKMMDKLDDLESRSRRNNLRIYGMHEEAESKNDSVAQFVAKWLREEFSVDSDLQIQRAHRALAPKPKSDRPPRSIIVLFQQFAVKEMILKKAWEKKVVTFDGHRIYFDHDYSERMLQQRKAYANVKKVLKREGIRFQTPLNKMRIHWAGGVKTYGSAEEATSDLMKRGYEADNAAADDGGTALVRKLRTTGISTWKYTESGRTEEASRRARGRLQEYQLRGRKAGQTSLASA